MEAYARWLEQERENEIVLPKLTAESAPLSRKVEAAGIEPRNISGGKAEMTTATLQPSSRAAPDTLPIPDCRCPCATPGIV
jgi:hypothetical protein